jgi:hypothetical protein
LKSAPEKNKKGDDEGLAKTKFSAEPVQTASKKP